ncbi:regulatory LuxR family protein [Nonomuraea polychroma]|uniref:Regulatory LuxR family protein n=1 Tax=Nonomuraea polychroma TaxID=46176 RepID=A0A438M707_9ACTN|nr:LuxR family transcriptional regulator [Nonomuraea polychroma]RVX41511.1 regulatory LuxR family protein [Nonomuraea polychroma]
MGGDSGVLGKSSLELLGDVGGHGGGLPTLGSVRSLPGRVHRSGTKAGLLGRQAECEALDRLLAAVRVGQSRALVVRGEAGVGKTALLEHLTQRASGCRVVCAAGVQSEMEVAFAALHSLCAPMLDLLDGLPGPQRDALGTAFGLRAGPAPDRLLLGLAVLSLLAAAADERPLVCVIDDAQWLDHASAQVLAFVARRLVAESVACVFAVRGADEMEQLSGLPVMDVAGLSAGDARALLRSMVPGPLDEQVRDRLAAEARGNPLALLELVREFTRPELAGGFGLPTAQTLSGRIENAFRRQLERMPAHTRRLLLLAAADPLGDAALVWRAAARLGLGMAVIGAANDMIVIGVRVRFRHPLARSAVYRAALPEERRRVHLALAEATDADPDRRAWHRAHGTAQPDEEVAAELERSAARAQARGGLAAVGAFLERAAALTPDPQRRAERALAAARAKHLAGAPEPALVLLASAQAGPLDELRLAHAELLHAEIASASNPGRSAVPMLLKAAGRFEPLDTGLARDTYLQALSAAICALPDEGPGLVDVAAATRAAPPAPATPRVADLLLDALGRHFTEDARSAAPAMRRALAFFLTEDISAAEESRWLWAAHIIAVALWDDRSSRELADRHVRLVRDTGALALLPLAWCTRLIRLTFEGELDEAASVNEEIQTLVAATGVRTCFGYHGPGGGALAVAAWRGQQAETEHLADALMSEAASHGEGSTVSVSQWLRAVLHNGLGRHEEARAAAERACAYHPSPGAAAHWAPAELVEAAVYSGERELAARALEQLVATTQASGTDWALGVEARSRALLSQGDEAEDLYRAAIDRLRRTRMRVDLARSHLVYGEWLRRERRRLDAREQLRTAYELFMAMGMDGFAGRAERELVATGEMASRRTVETVDQLTPQEKQIVRLARQGMTNKEIAAHVYVSPRTVEYHLRKVFAKLGITSRNQLQGIA